MQLSRPTALLAATVSAPSPDPWAWSLDSVIAVAGVLATVSVAVVGGLYALSMTRRRGREEQRQRRARLAAAIDRYVEARLNGFAADEHKAMQETAAAEGFSTDSAEINWVERHAEDVMVLHRDMPRGPKGDPLEHSWWLAYGMRITAIRQRLFGWIATGQFDLTPLRELEFDADGRPRL